MAYRIREIDEAVRMISSLSNFSVFPCRGQNVITLAEEEQHIRSYLEIQQMRYRDLIKYEISVPDQLKLHSAKANAATTGGKRTLSWHKTRRRQGLIRVTGRTQQDRLILEVSDDGTGMTEERLTLYGNRSGLTNLKVSVEGGKPENSNTVRCGVWLGDRKHTGYGHKDLGYNSDADHGTVQGLSVSAQEKHFSVQLCCGRSIQFSALF